MSDKPESCSWLFIRARHSLKVSGALVGIRLIQSGTLNSQESIVRDVKSVLCYIWATPGLADLAGHIVIMF